MAETTAGGLPYAVRFKDNPRSHVEMKNKKVCTKLLHNYMYYYIAM